MASMTQGTPGSSTGISTTTTPQWMQDAIFNTISWSQNLANKPYAPYTGQRIAPLSEAERRAAQTAEQAAGAYQPYLSQSMGTLGRAGGLSAAGAAAGALGRAETMTAAGAAQPFLERGLAPIEMAGRERALAASQPYISQAIGASPLMAAQPYLAGAAQTFPGAVQQYMSPYVQNVVKGIADVGERQLREKLLPAVGEEFIKAGQFGPGPGSSRMGEFGARALRDVNEAILAEQSKALQAGYGQAADIFASDVGRLGTLAGTAGQLGGAQQRAILEAAQTAGQLSTADLDRLLRSGASVADIGQTLGGLSAQDITRLADIGQTRGQLTSQDAANLRSIAQQEASAAEAAQALGLRGATAVTGIGERERDLAQRALDLAYQQYQEETRYPYEQIGFQAGIIGGVPSGALPKMETQTTTAQGTEASTLSKILGGLAGAAGIYKTLKG